MINFRVKEEILVKNIHGQNILAAAIAVSLGCSLTEFLPAAYAAPTDTAQTASNDADDSLMDFSLDTMTVEAKRPDWESKLSPGTVNIDIVNIGLHFFHKDVRLMLPLVVKHSIVAA